MLLRYAKKNQLLIVLAVFVVGALILFGCGEKEPKVFKIGAILPLTGNSAAIGEMERNALLLAVGEINTDGGISGRKIELVVEDSKGQAKDGMTAGMKLMDVDKVKFIITSLTSVSEAIQPEIQNRKLLQYAYTFDPSLPKRSDYTFRIYPSSRQASELMLEYINSKGFKKVAEIYIDVPAYMDAIENIMAPKLKEWGVEFSKESFKFGDLDVKAQLLKLKSFEPEILIVNAYPFQIPMVFKGLAELSFNPQIIGDMPFLVKLNVSPEQLEGVLVTTPEYAIDPSLAEAFIEAFKNKYNKEPDFDAAFVYASFKILASAIKQGGNDVEKVRQNLLQIKQYKGITGNIEILPNGDSQVAMSLGIFKDGKIVTYTGQ